MTKWISNWGPTHLFPAASVSKQGWDGRDPEWHALATGPAYCGFVPKEGEKAAKVVDPAKPSVATGTTSCRPELPAPSRVIERRNAPTGGASGDGWPPSLLTTASHGGFRPSSVERNRARGGPPVAERRPVPRVHSPRSFWGASFILDDDDS